MTEANDHHVQAVAEALDRIPGIHESGRIRLLMNLVTEQDARIRFLPNEIDSAYGLARSIASSTGGMRVFARVIEQRSDIFAPGSPETKDLLVAVNAATGVIDPGTDPGHVPEDYQFRMLVEEIRDETEKLFGESDVGCCWKVAYYVTWDRGYVKRSCPAPWSDDPTPSDCVDQLLSGGGRSGVRDVLMFFERIAVLVEDCREEHRAGTERRFRAAVDRFAPRAGLSEVDGLRRAVTGETRLLRARRHVLVRLVPEPEDEHRVHLTVWEYIDDQYCSSPVPKQRWARFLMADVFHVNEVRKELGKHVNGRSEDIVIEVMRPNEYLNDPVDTLLPKEHGQGEQRFNVVVRPIEDPCGITANRFARWREVVDARRHRPFHSVPGSRLTGGVPPVGTYLHHPAICVRADYVRAGRSRQPRPDEFVQPLLDADISVIAWCREGNDLDEHLPAQVTFRTPTEWSRDAPECFTGVLLWHNPHWMPDGESQFLEWRGAAP